VSFWRITTKPVNKEKVGKQNAIKQKQSVALLDGHWSVWSLRTIG